jgi:hypothetical protein
MGNHANLFRRDVGLAQTFVELQGDDVIIGDVMKGSGWIWNDEKRLWVASQRSQISAFVGNVLLRHLDELVYQIEEAEGPSSDPSNADSLKEIRDRVLSTRGQQDIFQMVMPQRYNSDFIATVNMDKDALPILHGLKVNLRDGTTQLRERTDYFSVECPVSLCSSQDELQVAKRFFSEIMEGDRETID